MILPTYFAGHGATAWALSALVLLMIVQVLVADLAGIRARHTPGAPVAPDHGQFLFRATRVVGNSNETIAIFLLLLLFGLLRGADAVWLAAGAWSYAASRALYAVCYWADWRLARSIMFGMGLAVLVLLLGVGAVA